MNYRLLMHITLNYIYGTHCMKYYYMDEYTSKVVQLPQRLTEPQNFSRFSAKVRHTGGDYNMTEYGMYCIQLKFAIDPLAFAMLE
jgi:hypothetical protein